MKTLSQKGKVRGHSNRGFKNEALALALQKRVKMLARQERKALEEAGTPSKIIDAVAQTRAIKRLLGVY